MKYSAPPNLRTRPFMKEKCKMKYHAEKIAKRKMEPM